MLSNNHVCLLYIVISCKWTVLELRSRLVAQSATFRTLVRGVVTQDYKVKYTFGPDDHVLTSEQLDSIRNKDEKAFKASLTKIVTGYIRIAGEDWLFTTIATMNFKIPIEGTHTHMVDTDFDKES